MRILRVWKAFLIATSVLLGTVAVHATSIVAPTGLTPGSQFRVVFVSSGTIAANASCAPTPYDSFVANEASAAGINTYHGNAVTWDALISAPCGASGDAINRLPSDGVPIYDLSGDLIANSSHSIWSGSLLHNISLTENDALLSGVTVWTGTQTNGFHVSCDDVGNGCGPGQAEFGLDSATNSTWTVDGIGSQSTPMHMYAFSSIIIAQAEATVPEPGTLGLVALAGALLSRMRARRKH